MPRETLLGGTFIESTLPVKFDRSRVVAAIEKKTELTTDNFLKTKARLKKDFSLLPVDPARSIVLAYKEKDDDAKDKHVNVQELLDPALSALAGYLDQFSLALPAISDRVLFADTDTLVNHRLLFDSVEQVQEWLYDGLTPRRYILPNGLVLINNHWVNGLDPFDGGADKKSPFARLRDEALMGVCETLAWKGKLDTFTAYGLPIRVKRDGLSLSSHPDEAIVEGTRILDHEFERYLAAEALTYGGMTPAKPLRAGSSGASHLARFIGDAPLVRAYMTKKGLTELIAIIDTSPSLRMRLEAPMFENYVTQLGVPFLKGKPRDVQEQT